MAAREAMKGAQEAQAAAEAQFPGKTCGHNRFDPLQRAYVSRYAEFCFLHIKVSITGTKSHVSGTDHVHSAADTGALNRRNNRHTRRF